VPPFRRCRLAASQLHSIAAPQTRTPEAVGCVRLLGSYCCGWLALGVGYSNLSGRAASPASGSCPAEQRKSSNFRVLLKVQKPLFDVETSKDGQ